MKRLTVAEFNQEWKRNLHTLRAFAMTPQMGMIHKANTNTMEPLFSPRPSQFESPVLRFFKTIFPHAAERSRNKVVSDINHRHQNYFVILKLTPRKYVFVYVHSAAATQHPLLRNEVLENIVFSDKMEFVNTNATIANFVRKCLNIKTYTINKVQGSPKPNTVTAHMRALLDESASFPHSRAVMYVRPEAQQHKYGKKAEKRFGKPPKSAIHLGSLQQQQQARGGMKILICNCSTIEAADALTEKGYNVAFLNFANAFFPGGGFDTTTGAQEEHIFRNTDLAHSLLPHQPSDNNNRYFSDYWKNYRCEEEEEESEGKEEEAAKEETEIYYPMPIVSAIYTPRVIRMHKNDEQTFLPRFKEIGACLTVAAPDLRHETFASPEILNQLLDDKLKLMLDVAESNKHDALVLGAFGNGVFLNDPITMAQRFHRLLRFRTQFKFVAFAILAKDASTDRNFCAYKEVFKH